MSLIFDTETQRPPRQQWISCFRDATDGLVHLAREGWRSITIHGTDGAWPSIAYTDCGLIVTCTDGIINAGEYLGKETPLTCVRCAGGANDGKQKRHGLKEMAFAVMYGASQSELRQRYGELVHTDVAGIFGLYGNSLYRRCRRLAHVLYAKATA